MKYEIHTTETFTKWFKKLDNTTRVKLLERLSRVECGNFGDYKEIENDLFELRCFFGGGVRVYFTVRSGMIVLLLAGGNKDTQTNDIKKAKAILESIEE